jgi:hypothetical protein
MCTHVAANIYMSKSLNKTQQHAPQYESAGTKEDIPYVPPYKLKKVKELKRTIGQQSTRVCTISPSVTR